MTPSGERRRAPAMSPEQRREMIITTTMPLVAEFGATVTTAQVARAAGIAEGTIFRVFADKEDLLCAVMAEALRPDSVHADIAAVDLEQPLADRLVEAAEALGAYVQRIGTITGALQATGFRSGRRATARPAPATDRNDAQNQAAQNQAAHKRTAESSSAAGPDDGGDDGRRLIEGGRARVMAETTAVLADLFAPEATAGTLRRPAPELAAAFFGMLTVAQRGDLSGLGDGPPSAADLVDLFLYGALERHEKS
ncbi:TetR/AcrR family transcriptional regulator [Catenuloplanes sp. NPDC051500]|uniref:TetR/AcrR family transcriptional regulator n=1 Tax=Catenuloplanes sp. NPDC051500 TaxID=3363959 RepID=UPI00379B5B00